VSSVFLETDSDVKAVLVSKPVAVAPGERISLEIRCRADHLTSDSGGALFLNAGFIDRAGRYLSWARERPALPSPGEWFEINLDAVVPAGVAAVTLQAGVDRMTGGVWWDAAALRAESPMSVRFELDGGTCEPGTVEVPIMVINREPAMQGKPVVISGVPGGRSGLLVLSRRPETSASASFLLTERGRTALSVTVKDSAGEAPLCSAEQVITVPPLLEVEPLVPTHFRVEDGTPCFEVRVWVHERQDIRHELSLECAVRRGQDTIAARREQTLGPNPLVLDLPVSSAGIGDYEVEFAVLRGEGELEQWVEPWHVIRRADIEVSIRQDGFLEVGGKPFLPIGMFNGFRFEEQAAAGFNVTHAYNAAATRPGSVPHNRRVKQFLDTASDCGMKALLLITHGSHSRPVDEEFIRRVRMFRNHPGLLAWDEEEGVARGEMPLSNLELMWRTVREETPERFLMVGDARDAISKITDRSRLFPEEFMDLGMWWWYPFPLGRASSPDPLEGEERTAAVELVPPSFLVEARTEKPIWVGLQAYRKPGRVDGRFPTPAEYRAQAYLALIHGAKGIMYYVGSGSQGFGILNRPEEGNWEYLKQLAAELRLMAPVFMAADAQGDVAVIPETAPVSFRLKQTPEGSVLLAVNRMDQPVQVSFRLPETREGPARVRFEDRSLGIHEGRLADAFQPFGVHVYELW